MGRKGREKFNVGSATRRRTVLQIEPVSRRKENEGSQQSTRRREINPTSISGIGLLGQYAENSDDEEQKGSSSGEENVNEEDQTKPHDEVQIDSKLSDFFKEIEAISTEESKSTEINETAGETSAVDEATMEEPADASTLDQNMQGYDVPSPWQQVCDPVTSYIYYWNTLTNEVSWELPEIVEPVQPQLATVEQLPQDALSPQDVDDDHQSNPENLTEDQSTLSREDIATKLKDDTLLEADGEGGVTTSSAADCRDEQEESLAPIQGAAEMPLESKSRTSDLATREMARSSPDKLDDNILYQSEKGLDEGTSTTSETDHTSKTESSVSRKRERPAVIDMFESEARVDDLHQNESEKQESILEYWTEERMKNAVPEEMPEYSPSAENGHVSTNTSPDYGQSDGDISTEGEEVDGKDREILEPTERSEKEDDDSDDDDLEVPAKKTKYDTESDHESEGEFAEKLLEEFLEGKSTDIASSGDDMEVESDNDQQEDEVSAPLLPPEAFQHNRADKLKDDGGNSPADIPRSRAEVDRKAEEESEKITTEIHDLCQLLSNKLEFLNITKDGLNKLLIVLIQMETRIKDWREGGLNSAYIVKKLREAAEELNRYEQSAVPKGWSCHWDRTYKRYFYANEKTGESQWEYPAENSTTSDASSVETKKMYSVPDNVTGSWDASVMKESTSASPNVLTSSIEQSHLYPSNITNISTYPVVAATSSIMPTNVTQDISSLAQVSETNYSTLPSSLDNDANTSTIYPVFQPSTASTDVTKDPYRLDDDSPVASENSREHGNTPPPPGLSPPPPPPADVQTVPPPPPPQDDVVNMIIPAPPPPSIPENVKSNQVEHSETSAEKSGVVQIQRPLVDYSDLESTTHQSNIKVREVQASGSSRSSPVHLQTTSKPKKKKSKSSSVPIRTSKVKKMSSLVQKWQAIKKQEEENLSEDESDEEDHAAKTEAQIEQWRQEQITSGLAADNPNFQEITGDWRERVRKAKLRTAAKTE